MTTLYRGPIHTAVCMPAMACIVLLTTALGIAWADAATTAASPKDVTVRIQYATMEDSVTIRFSSDFTITSGNTRFRVDAGEYTFSATVTRPAQQRYHVFPKTFQPGEEVLRDAYISEWRARGYDPQIETFGRRFQNMLDNRSYWVSLARFDSEQQARALIESLKQEHVWAWLRPERTAPGAGGFTIHGTNRSASEGLNAPLTLTSEAPIEVVDVSSSFWRQRRENRLLQGPLTLAIGPDKSIEVYGDLPVETYLRGVVPAEMPPAWPEAALRAQAIVARSEIYASLAGKYRLEGFDFTALESCRAYLGLGGHAARTDAAVADTGGMALVHDGKYVATVFSSSCGGWTENNENVWSGPANPMLRGKSDLSRPVESGLPSSNLGQWLSTRPPAWCSGDETGFRWQKSYTTGELSALVNTHHDIGTIHRIEEGPRGVSGRLKSVTITGSRGTATVERELAIRRAFGGLPSAMFIIQETRTGSTPGSYTFLGGGRGHGVGLCQHGARGMAAAGRKHEEIVAHYFPGAALERTR